MENKELGMNQQLDLKRQVEALLDTIWRAWLARDVPTVIRGKEMLRMYLWQWFPKARKEQYTKLDVLKPKELEEFYTAEDKTDLAEYGELEDDRMAELSNAAKKWNDTNVEKSCLTCLDLIMETVKERGWGFSITLSSDS